MVRYIFFGVYIAVPINFVVAQFIDNAILSLIIIAIFTTALSVYCASKLVKNHLKMIKISKILGIITIVIILILIIMLIGFFTLIF